MTNTPTVFITGCSTGIGRATAVRLQQAGWRVFAGVRRGADGERLLEAAPGARWLIADVCDPASIEAATRLIRAEAGGLDALVNNAGIAIGGPLEFVALDQVRYVFEVNVLGALAVTQAMLPLLRESRGRIVNVGSIAGRLTSPMVGPYCMSKHAVEALTDGLRQELHPWGIHVSVVEPGMIATPIWEKGERQADQDTPQLSEEARQRYAGPLRALGRILKRAPRAAPPPEVVARVIARALTVRVPRTRYVIGRDARIRLVLQSLLPRRLMDALVRRVYRRLGTPRP